MKILKPFSICAYAIGIAIITKYWDFRPWVEANNWIGVPMAVIGAIGICTLFGEGD